MKQAGVMHVCNDCVYQLKAVTARCCSPIDCAAITEQPDLKPLAQYLFGYDCEYANVRSSREYFERALEAYQSTENVTIKIERNA